MFFLVLSYVISLTLLQMRFHFHPSKGVHWCCRKRLFELLEAPLRRCSENTTVSKFLHIFHTFQRNIEGGVPFKYIRRPFWNFFQKVLQNSYSEENLLAPAYVKKNFTAYVIPGIFQNFKSMQGKAGGCNLKNCNLLIGTP